MNTKTICTIGPVSQKPEILEKLVLGGMDIARFNMSHASNEEFILRKALIDQYNTLHGKKVEILMDLQGPRMRWVAQQFEVVERRGLRLVLGWAAVDDDDTAARRADPHHLPEHPERLDETLIRAGRFTKITVGRPSPQARSMIFAGLIAANNGSMDMSISPGGTFTS